MSHYFTTPEGPGRRRQVSQEIWGHRHDFVTDAGVFSSDGLDQGTAVLLRSVRPAPQARRVLDLGCGWGPIAVAVATTVAGARVDAVDVNDRALELCRDNAAAAGVADRLRPIRPEALLAEDPAGYDEIWSNPPIRIGKPALHELLATWLPRLAPTGRAHLVVGRHLGADSLQRWIIEQGFDCARVASAKGFRVFTVTPTGR